MSKAPLAFALVSLALVCLTAGCGSGSKASTSIAATTPGTSTTANAPSGEPSAGKIAYERKMQRLGNQLGAVQGDVGSYDQMVIDNASGEQTTATLITKELTMLQRRLRRAAAQLAAINPPADVRSAHGALRRGVLEYASELTGVIALVRTGNFNALESIANLKGVLAMQTATTAITRKGYIII